MSMQKMSLCLLAVVMLAVGGCNIIGYMGYLVAPDGSKKTVEPEFANLPNSKLAIVVYADPSTLYEYPFLRYEVSSAIANQLGKNVENLTIVQPEQVIYYQDQNLQWESEPRSELGKQFQADHLMYVTLSEFTTREPGSAYLYRGHVTAQVHIYKTSLPERDSCVWRSGDIRLVCPENEPIGTLSDDDRVLRMETQRRLADIISKKFYKHTVQEKQK